MIVDATPLFRQGIRAVLLHTGKYTIVGEARDPPEALALARAEQPDVVLLSGQLPDARTLTWQLRQLIPTIGILVFAASPDEEQLFQFIKAGASAYEPPTITGEVLTEKVSQVGCGNYLITSDVLLAPSSQAIMSMVTDRKGAGGKLTEGWTDFALKGGN